MVAGGTGRLAELGIYLKRNAPGEHRAACPRCAEAKRRSGDDALAVKAEPGGGCTWLCHRCGWRGTLPPAATEQRLGHQPPTVEARPPPEPTPFPDVAARLWAARRAIRPGTIAARYLEGRSCALPPPEGHLAWHSEVFHPVEGRSFPALLALVTDALTGAPLTVHRTFLAPDGSGKAPVGKSRLLVKGGSKAGGVVRLWPDEAVVTGLCVGEGLETCLAAARGFGLAWALIDACNLASLPVLPGIESLTVCVDHDRAGLDAFNTVAARWLGAGREVRQWLPAEHGADVNDWLGAAA